MEPSSNENWKGGGKYGRRNLNRYRYVEDFLEVELGDFIMKCDMTSLYLIQEYRWRCVCGYVKTSINENGTHRTYMFSRLVLGSPDGHVTYINKDKLDNRKDNLRAIKAKVREDLDYIVPPVLKRENFVVETSEWYGGKPSGSLNQKGGGWVVRFRNPKLRKYFGVRKYWKNALVEARKFHYEEAKRRGVIRNQYRLCTSSKEETFFEVQCQKGSFFCDLRDLPVVERCVWSIIPSTNGRVPYVLHSSRKGQNLPNERFHKLIVDYQVVDHIDGNPLNNRRYNLRDGTVINPKNYPKRKDNVSGVTGVSFNKSKNLWIVQWPEGGKRRFKSFSVIKGKRTSLEAKQMAIDFRLQIDQRLGLHQQQKM